MADEKDLILWHYTSIENLEKILKSKKILAKRLDMFPDISEYNAGKEIVENVILTMDYLDKDCILLHVDESYNTKTIKRRSFAFCMTKSFDSVIHWQKRCPNGGVSIGFSKNKIDECVKSYNETFKNTQIIFLSEQYYCKKCFGDFVEKEIRERRFGHIDIRCFAPLLYKDGSKYMWENEFRQTLVYDNIDFVSEIKRDDGIVFSEQFKFGEDIIQQIIISPSDDASENISKIKGICNKNGFSPDIVIPSSHCRSDT